MLLTRQGVVDGLVNEIENLYLWRGSFVAVERERRFDHRSFVSDASSRMSRPYGSRTFSPDRLRGERRRCLSGTTLLLMEPAGWGSWLSHLYHLHEHLLAVWDLVGSRVDRIVLVGDGHDPGTDWAGPNDVSRKILRALWPSARVVAWDDLRRSSEERVIRLENVVSVDRGVSLADERCRAVNKMLGRRVENVPRESVEDLASRVLRASGLRLRGSGDRIVWVKREEPRRLRADLEASLLDLLRRRAGLPLIEADLANMSFEEQLAIVSRARVLLGVHGNGLTHALFAPRDATLIEIFPRDALMQDYAFVARMRGLRYVAFDGAGKVSRRRLTGHRGHDVVNHPVDDLDVRAVSREVERAVCSG